MNTTLESTFTNISIVLIRLARASVALVVNIQRDNIMDPEGRQVQNVSRLHDHFISSKFQPVGEFDWIGFGPVHFTMSTGGMAVR